MKARTALPGLVALLVLAGMLLLLGQGVVKAQGGSYDISWWTVDGGGTTSSAGGAYSLGGTAGQPEPGVLSGGAYTLGEGFWRGGVPNIVRFNIYLPVVVKNG